jgi:hypothetical protein
MEHKDGRFFYCREHDHPMGWSVRDRNRYDDVVAYGDKNVCAFLAWSLNGEVIEPEFLETFIQCRDWSLEADKRRLSGDN